MFRDRWVTLFKYLIEICLGLCLIRLQHDEEHNADATNSFFHIHIISSQQRTS